MEYRSLGNTGLLVSKLCLGTMTYGAGGHGFWKVIGSLDVDECTKHISKAFDTGINFIDTANGYHQGVTEEVIGASFKKSGISRHRAVIATKVRLPMGEGPNECGLSRSHIINQVDESLRRLQLDYIDLYQIHGFDPLVPIEETLRALDDLVTMGKVRYIGLCNLPAWRIMKAISISDSKGWNRFCSLQMYYSIAGRDIEREVVPLALEEKLAILPWSPLAGGFLTGKFKRDQAGPAGARRSEFDFPPIDKERAFNCVDLMQEIADHRNVSVAQIALAWTLMQPGITSSIIGARTMQQLEENLAAAELILTEEEITKLDQVSKLPLEYPDWMVTRQSADRISYLV